MLARMGALFAFVFLAVPVIEVVLFIWIQDRIGLPWTLAGIVITAVIGASLVRSQGISVWRKFQDELATGGLPARQIAHGAMVLVGGALLLTPGYLTDAVGFSLMIPAVREGIRRVGARYVSRRTIIIR